MQKTVEMLKALVEEKSYVDVGKGFAEKHGIRPVTMLLSLSDLKKDGYIVHYVRLRQMGTQNNEVLLTILTKQGVTYNEVYENLNQISLYEAKSKPTTSKEIEMGKYTLGQDGVTLILHRVESGRYALIYGLNDAGTKLREARIGTINLWFAEPGNPQLLQVHLVPIRGLDTGATLYDLQWGVGDSLGNVAF